MPNIDRRRRAEIVRSAQRIRQQGQLSGWDVEAIAAAILTELEELKPLEAWRLAYGWTRPQVVNSIAALYVADGLAAPALNSSMLCRWEHGKLLPSGEYIDALCRVYRVTPDQLGLSMRALKAPSVADHVAPSPHRTGKPAGNNPAHQRTAQPGAGQYGQLRVDDLNAAAALAAVRESIQLGMEIEGPAGGPLTREQLGHAIDYYAHHYSAFAPAVLAPEVQRCRSLVTGMLGQAQPTSARNDLRRLAGWLSALLGNLAFHLAHYPAAWIHLGTAQRLGAGVGDARLICWSLGALSMIARYQHRYAEALDIARESMSHTTTPLTRAQVLVWAKLPALAWMGTQHRSEADRVLAAARREMDTDPEGEQPGRFGLDLAEFELHVAEAYLALDEPIQTAAHAQAALERSMTGRPGWAAAMLVLAASEARRRRPGQAADLAMTVLDSVSPDSLRETARQRLVRLGRALGALDKPHPTACDLHERLRTVLAFST